MRVRLCPEGVQELSLGLLDPPEVMVSEAPVERVLAGLAGCLEMELQAYFAGELREFSVPVAATGTAFQRRVWEELRRIPYASTMSYAELAGRIGNPSATRAVGAANGRNPVPILVPCHRVVATGGGLGGFSAGLARKRWLLDLEQYGPAAAGLCPMG